MPFIYKVTFVHLFTHICSHTFAPNFSKIYIHFIYNVTFVHLFTHICTKIFKNLYTFYL